MQSELGLQVKFACEGNEHLHHVQRDNAVKTMTETVRQSHLTWERAT